MTPETVFLAIITVLHVAGIPYQAFEDHSIQLLGYASEYVVAAVHYLHTING